MKMKGKPREVVDLETGERKWSMYPISREEAIQEDVVKFWPMIPCEIHGGKPVVYTKTQIRGCCAQIEAVEEYNAAVYRGEPVSIHEAREQNKGYYWRPTEHPLCGHPGKVRLDGKCCFCIEARSQTPRQLALAAGEAWYTPALGDECKNGHLSRRRVANGICEECEQEAAKARAEKRTPEVYEAAPDMVLSKEDAKLLGFTFYHGNPCKQGHNGWRYVSTNNCVHCRREREVNP